MTMKQKFYIYTDGGARGNPGPAGSGAVVTDAKGVVVAEAHKALGVQTNNFAEYQAVIVGLEALKRAIGREKIGDADIEIRMDSELVQRQLSGKYQIKEETLWPMFIKIWNLRVSEFPHVSFVHIPRENNKHADKLSNDAMDESERQLKGNKTLF